MLVEGNRKALLNLLEILELESDVSTDINDRLPTFKCYRCNMRQRTNTLRNGLKCEVILHSDSKKKFTIPQNIIKNK